MNYKLTSDTLLTERTEIGISIIDGHVLLHVKAKRFSASKERFIKFKVKTSIKGNLTIFERRVVLIDAYKKLTESNSIQECKDALNDNYAGVFGSGWE